MQKTGHYSAIEMNYWYIQQHGESQNNYAEQKKPGNKGCVW